jgi:putative phosphoribosyl transferase
MTLPDFNRPVILVDNGLASKFTLRTATEALHKQGCREIILAVPTAHEESLRGIVEKVDSVFCPNIRSGPSFAVADVNEHWRDLNEDKVLQILDEFKTRSSE